MNSPTRPRVLTLACLATTLASGCDLGIGPGLGCALQEGFSDLGESFTRAFGSIETVHSDDEQFFADAYCGRDDCERRDVLQGSGITLWLEFSDQDRAVTPGPDDIEITSSAPDVLALDGFEPRTGGCGQVFATGELRFAELGEGALVVREFGVETARFTFRVHEAETLRIVMEEPLTDGGVRWGGDTLRGPSDAAVWIETEVRSAGGEWLSTGGEAHFWVDDPEVAHLHPFGGGRRASGTGHRQLLVLATGGTTRVHALVGNLTAAIAIEVGDDLPDADAGGQTPDDDAGVGDSDAEGAQP